jgi:hypothetical protein
MRSLTSAVLLFTALVIGASPATAQQKRISPHETISAVFEKNRVTLVYGRPYSKDPKTGEMRKIWGGLVPYGRPWRTGADEATLLITQNPIVLGGTVIPAGAYTLFTQPEADGTAKLIVSSQIGQWGLQYNPAKDFARVDLTRSAIETPVDQFTMELAKNPAGGGLLKMRWENTEYSVAYTLQK